MNSHRGSRTHLLALRGERMQDGSRHFAMLLASKTSLRVLFHIFALPGAFRGSQLGYDLRSALRAGNGLLGAKVEVRDPGPLSAVPPSRSGALWSDRIRRAARGWGEFVAVRRR
jgi:hypothetical protein